MTSNLRRNARLLIVAAVSAAAVATATTVYVIACGPFVYDLETVRVVHPADIERFEKGEVGVVRPRLARRYLVQAYRTFSGKPPLVVTTPPSDHTVDSGGSQRSPLDAWLEARDRVLGTNSSASERIGTIEQVRYVGNDYQSILNCPDDAFTTALKTLAARQGRFGEGSEELRGWTRAQTVVFSNCPGPAVRSNPPPGALEPVFLPDPAPAGADALVRADRAYQTAAAYFYGLQYEEAARRFREIASDKTSPWRPYGQYLAARATIRRATVGDEPSAADRDRLLVSAQDELKRVIADPSASALHESARGLIDFVDARLRIIERLHRVSGVLANGTTINSQDFDDYRWMMDRLVGDTIDYRYTEVQRREEVVANDELNDWVLAVQGQGTAAVDRAIARWRASRTPLWLVAALWKADAKHPAAAEIVDAARAIEGSSPAYATVTFLRVRLLAGLGRRDEARALLASLPDNPEPGFQAETINLLKAERMMLAGNLDEFLTNATRTTVRELENLVPEPDGQFRRDSKQYDQPVFDADAGVVFSHRLPLDRLVEAASSTALPDRLRVRVAMAAFTRAVLLRRDEAGLRAASILRQLAPPMAADLDRYAKAANAGERHIAAILLLMRTPGLHADVRGTDDESSVNKAEPSRSFEHLGGNWWCEFQEPTFNNLLQGVPEVLNLLYPTRQMPYPAFITAAERSASEQELKALATVGAARSYLAAEVLLWARARPKDPDVPEALALIVEGWRWNASCFGESDNWQLAQRAFQTLHARYPDSTWAQRTKYWYK